MNALFGFTVLAGFALHPVAAAAADRFMPFNGTWLQCEKLGQSTQCQGYRLQQSGTRVCGARTYWASNGQYDGLSNGAVSGSVLVIQSECTADRGAPNSPCPMMSSVANRRLLVCGSRLYEIGDRQISCNAIPKDIPAPYRKSTKPPANLFMDSGACTTLLAMPG
jgi:hypothetical protein